MTRGRTALGVVVLALVAVAAGGQEWLAGSVDDAVLGTGRVTADGGQVAPGAITLTLAVVASVVAALVTGGRVRRGILVVGLLAALGGAVLAVRVLLEPADVLGPIAAATVGRTGTIPVDAAPTHWAFVGACASGLLVVLVVAALLAAGRWPGPTRKYERTGEPAATTGSRGEQVRSDWEALSEGHDPTDVPDGRPT